MQVSNSPPGSANSPPAGTSSPSLFPYAHPTLYRPIASQIETQFNDFELSTGRPNVSGINDSEWNKFTATLDGKYSESDLNDAKEQTKTDDAFTLEATFADVQQGNSRGFSEDALSEFLHSVTPDLDPGVADQVLELARNDHSLSPLTPPTTGTGG